MIGMRIEQQRGDDRRRELLGEPAPAENDPRQGQDRGAGCDPGPGPELNPKRAHVAHDLGSEIGGGGLEQHQPLAYAPGPHQGEGENPQRQAGSEEGEDHPALARSQQGQRHRPDQVWLERAHRQQNPRRDFPVLRRQAETDGDQRGQQQRVLRESHRPQEREKAEQPGANGSRRMKPLRQLPYQQAPQHGVPQHDQIQPCAEAEPAQGQAEQRVVGRSVEVVERDHLLALGTEAGFEPRIRCRVIDPGHLAGGHQPAGEVELVEVLGKDTPHWGKEQGDQQDDEGPGGEGRELRQHGDDRSLTLAALKGAVCHGSLTSKPAAKWRRATGMEAAW